MISGRIVPPAVIAVLAAMPAAAAQPFTPTNGAAAAARGAATANAAASAEEEFRSRITELERQLEALKAQLANLAAVNAEQNRSTSAAAPAATVGAGRDGFQFRSADHTFQLRLRAVLQSDHRAFVNDRASIGTDTFVLRRVRPIVEATMFKNFDIRLMPDFGLGQTVVQDAYMDLRVSTPFSVRAGKFKEPFGIERLVSASELLFAERALPTTVAPNRDVGVMAYGDLAAARVSYAAGVFNGVADGGSGDIDDRDDKDFVARLFTHPFRTSTNERLQELGLGVAASYGTQHGSADAPMLRSYSTGGTQTYFRYLSDGTPNGTVIADGTRHRISAQGYYYAGRLGLLGEQVRSSQEIRKGALTTDAVTNSWQLAASWVLTGERASYRGVTPRTVFDPANGTWGAIEIAVRYNELRVDERLYPVFVSHTASARVAQAAAAGLNWYLNRNVKLVFNYEEIHFTGGASNGDRPAARELTSRFQYAF